MTPTESLKDEDVQALIEAGADITGGLTGALAAACVGDPVGALWGATAGATLAHTFRALGSEIKRRVLGRREEQRIGAVVGFAIARIDERLRRGDLPRTDGFFEASNGTRPAAEEVYEGMVLYRRA